MTPKFPIWMTIVLVLQMLGALALAALLFLFGSMFDGTLGLGKGILIVLVLQILGALALDALLFVFGSMFDDTLGLGKSVLIGIIVMLPSLCWWLARRQWGNGHQRAATALTFMPVILILAFNAIAALMMR